MIIGCLSVKGVDETLVTLKLLGASRRLQMRMGGMCCIGRHSMVVLLVLSF